MPEDLRFDLQALVDGVETSLIAPATVVELIEVGEPKLALELICSNLAEAGHPLSADLLSRIEALASKLLLDQEYIDSLPRAVP